VRDGFVGGRCGGAAPAQGRPLAADRPKYNNEGRKIPLLASFRVAYQLRLSSYHIEGITARLSSAGKLQ